MDNLPAAFDDAVQRFSSAVALVDGQGRSISFADLQQRARGFAAHCAACGIGKGDTVLLAMPVGIDLYVALSAIWNLGAVAVFPEPALGIAGLRHAARVTKPKAYFTAGIYRCLSFIVSELWGLPTFRPSQQGKGAAPAIDLGADDLALISFTSGTTGEPKAIPRSHGFLMAQHRAVNPMLKSERAERDLVAFPVFVLVNLAEGRTSVLPNWKLNKHDQVRAEDICTWIKDQEITRLLFPPVLCEALAKSGTKLEADTIFTGGGPVFPDVVEQLKDQTPGLRVVSVYGSTEAEPIAELESSDVSPEDLEAMRTGGGLLAGHPVPAVQLRILEGEIVVAGDHVNQGYLNKAQDAETKIKEDGLIWHRTGDAGRLDEQGRLWLLGRCGQTCETKTGTLHPFAIETATRFWPGVQKAALSSSGEHPVLAIQGEPAQLPVWQEYAAAYGIADVRAIAEIPMDRRHRSKVDARRLNQMLASG